MSSAAPATATGRNEVRHRVLDAMAVRGLTRRDLADRAGIHRATIGQFLLGNRWLTVASQGALERTLGWPVGSIRRAEAGVEELPPVSWGDSDLVNAEAAS